MRKPMLAILVLASAMASQAKAGGMPGLGEVGVFEAAPVSTTSQAGRVEAERVIEFVLKEVRRKLEPNPGTEILELKIDPDYRGAKDVYLVNAVLDSQGRRMYVGVIVKVSQTSEGLSASLGFID